MAHLLSLENLCEHCLFGRLSKLSSQKQEEKAHNKVGSQEKALLPSMTFCDLKHFYLQNSVLMV